MGYTVWQADSLIIRRLELGMLLVLHLLHLMKKGHGHEQRRALSTLGVGNFSWPSILRG